MMLIKKMKMAHGATLKNSKIETVKDFFKSNILVKTRFIEKNILNQSVAISN